MAISERKRARRRAKAMAMEQVSLDELKSIPRPKPMGTRHRPIPHFALAREFEDQLKSKGYDPVCRWSVSSSGMHLAGNLRLETHEGARADLIAMRQTHGAHFILPPSMRMLAGAGLAVEHANDESHALSVMAMMEFYICTNLAILPEEPTYEVRRKHSGDEDLEVRVSRMIDRALLDLPVLSGKFEAWKDLQLDVAQVRLIIYEGVVVRNILAPNLIDDVHRQVFPPYPEVDEVGPPLVRAYDLHQAFTQIATHKLPLHRRFAVGQATTKLLDEALARPEKKEAVA